MANIRPLHWRFNVAERQREVAFFKDVLGMKILRHEEFVDEVDQSTAQRTSKTIMGYVGNGYFTLELHHKYGAPEYKTGNDFLGVTIVSKTAIARAKALNWPIDEIGDKLFRVQSPQGFTFYLMNEPTPTDCDPIAEICLRSSFLSATTVYWRENFGAQVLSKEIDQVTLTFGEEKCKIRFVCWFGQLVEHRNGSGQLTMSMSRKQLQLLEYHCLENNRKHSSQHSIVEPGYSAPCESLVFRDPDNHKIVIDEEESYSPLVSPNPDAHNAFDLSLLRELQRNEQPTPVS